MMRLSHMLKNEEILSLEKPKDTEVARPIADAARIRENDVFFCENAFSESGLPSALQAYKNGAALIVTRQGGKYRIGKLPIPIVEVENVRQSYALAWSRYENHPENALRLIAVTGTNGKTSVSSFLREILHRAGCQTGLVGTVSYSDGISEYPSEYTTPPPDILYPLFSQMQKKHTSLAVMEASSHAIAQERLYGLKWQTAIFTGLSRDHLDYHKTWESYRDTKARLFRDAEKSLINLDGACAGEIAFAAAGDVYYFGQKPQADFYIENPVCDREGIRYTLHTDGHALPIAIPLIGNFHVYNTAAAIAAAYLAGIDAATITEIAPSLRAPVGRLEKLPTATDFAVYIDYAHTPDALAKALLSLRPFTKKLTVLFGAGGERDQGKRAEMGACAEVFADFVILTNDNPRGEDPLTILRDIESGMTRKNHVRIPDRAEAIAYALQHAEKDEIILLAGKGHENYVLDKNGKTAFSERETVQRILNQNRKGIDNVS
jgi:UDP-N-acetylmuramoyl-L-alanyl-D-glutamate--2,6-diaminopimelate ligase